MFLRIVGRFRASHGILNVQNLGELWPLMMLAYPTTPESCRVMRIRGISRFDHLYFPFLDYVA